MIKRHEDALTARLEECAVIQGWCTIRDDEIRTWYDQKVTKTVWRDIVDRLNSFLEEPQKYKTYRHACVRLIVIDDDPLENLEELCE